MISLLLSTTLAMAFCRTFHLVDANNLSYVPVVVFVIWFSFAFNDYRTKAVYFFFIAIFVVVTFTDRSDMDSKMPILGNIVLAYMYLDLLLYSILATSLSM